MLTIYKKHRPSTPAPVPTPTAIATIPLTKPTPTSTPTSATRRMLLGIIESQIVDNVKSDLLGTIGNSD